MNVQHDANIAAYGGLQPSNQEPNGKMLSGHTVKQIQIKGLTYTYGQELSRGGKFIRAIALSCAFIFSAGLAVLSNRVLRTLEEFRSGHKLTPWSAAQENPTASKTHTIVVSMSGMSPNTASAEIQPSPANLPVLALHEAVQELRTAKNFDEQAACFQKTTDLLQDVLTRSYEHVPLAEQKRCVSVECDALDALVQLKRSMKKLPINSLSQPQQRTRDGMLERFKAVKRQLASYRLFDTFKKLSHLAAEGKEIGPYKREGDTVQALKDTFDRYTSKLGITIQKASLNDIVTNSSEWQRIRDCMRKELFQTQRLAEPCVRSLKGKCIQWISGSKSHALPLIMNKTLPGKGPALIPTGDLLRHNIAPLCGEVQIGIAGVNNVSLSGVGLGGLPTAVRYAEHPSCGFDVQATKKQLLDPPGSWLQADPYSMWFKIGMARLRVAVLRLLQVGGLAEKEKRPIKKALQKIQSRLPKEPLKGLTDQYTKFMSLVGTPIPKTASLLERPPTPLLRGQICGVSCLGQESTFAVLKSISGDRAIVVRGPWSEDIPLKELVWVDEQQMEICAQSVSLPPQEEEKKLTIDETMKTYSEVIDDMISKMDTVKPLPLTDFEKALVEHPFPMIWGSFTEGKPVFSDIRGEQKLEGPQELGKTIQFLFVPEEHLEEVQEYTKHIEGLQVASIDTVRYLHLGDQVTGFAAHIAP